MTDETQLCSVVKCREEQMELLTSFLGESGCRAVPGLFVYGHRATGKSLVIKTALQQLKHQFAVVNCIECYTSRLIFETVLDQFHPSSSMDQITNQSPVPNVSVFIERLREELLPNETSTHYIVFENAECLRKNDADLIPVLLRLHELTGCNVGVILESVVIWEKFRRGTGVREPIIIHFPQYSKEELVEIIASDCPRSCESHTYPDDVYRCYINLVLDIFYNVCRNLTELRHLAWLNFPKYVEPVERGEVDIDDTHGLWLRCNSHLKRALNTVYLNKMSSEQWAEQQSMTDSDTRPIGTSNETGHQFNLHLPYYTKFLLIAAYIASYNPTKTDKKFFMKNSGRSSKRAVLANQKRHERTSNHLLGPKVFTLDRMMAIFYSIVDEGTAPSANIFVQASTLVTLGLLLQFPGSDPLETPKYKCVVCLDQIKSIAKSVHFEILRYLYDFV